MSRYYLLTSDGYKDISEGILKKTSCREILTELGNVISVDDDLFIRTLGNSGEILFKKVSDLKIDDTIISEVNTNSFSEEDSFVDKKLSYLLGLLYSLNICYVGATFELEKNSVTNYISEYFYRYFETKFLEDKYTLYIPEEFIAKFNLNKDNIPDVILEGNKEIQESFIRGFFDINFFSSDRSIFKDGYSEEFLQQLSVLLKNLGIIAEVDNSTIMISGEEIVNYYNIVGTKNDYLDEEFMNIKLEQDDFYQIEKIVDICKEFYESTDKSIDFNEIFFNRKDIERLVSMDGDEVLKTKIKTLLNNRFCFEKVVSISDITSKSLDIDEDNEFIVNSFVIKK